MTNALPATPEVNEEHSGRSASPETKPQIVDTTGIYNYGQSYSAYYPTKFKAKQPLKNNALPKHKKKPKQRCCLLRGSGCFSRGRSGAYRVRNDTLPYFVRSSSVRPVGFNKISPPLSQGRRRQLQQQQLHQIDVSKGRIRLNLYAYPKGYLKFLDSYFVTTSLNNPSHNDESTKKRLSAISEEDVCPLCGSIDYALMKTANGLWKNALLVPF